MTYFYSASYYCWIKILFRLTQTKKVIVWKSNLLSQFVGDESFDLILVGVDRLRGRDRSKLVLEDGDSCPQLTHGLVLLPGLVSLHGDDPFERLHFVNRSRQVSAQTKALFGLGRQFRSQVRCLLLMFGLLEDDVLFSAWRFRPPTSPSAPSTPPTDQLEPKWGQLLRLWQPLPAARRGRGSKSLLGSI